MYTITDHGNGMVTIVTRGYLGVTVDLHGYEIAEVTEYYSPLGVSRCTRWVLSCYNTDHDDASGDITVTHITPDDL
ncbi:MAG: hypothetical protein ACYCZR_03005 [Burkholderiales bacterium]